MIIETSHMSKSPLSSRQRSGLVLAVILIGLIISLIAYASLHYKAGLFGLNVPALDWLMAHREPLYTKSLYLVTTLVSPKAFSIILASVAIIWLIAKREFYRPILLIAATGVGVAVATILKSIIHNARPPQIDMIMPFETGFSFPSMHTIAITVFLLMFGYLIYSRKFSGVFCWLWNLLSILLIALVALSRLYLGYHWVTDVVAAFGLGLVVFGVVVLVDNFLIKRFDLTGSEQIS